MWVVTETVQDDVFIAGRKWLSLVGWIMLLFGFCEVVASLIVLSDTSGYFIGGWYLGVLCTLAGGRAVRLRGIRSVKWLYVLSFCAFIASLIGTALQLENYLFLRTLKACSSYDSGVANTCSHNASLTGYTCTGDSNYFLAAEACEVNYVEDGSDTSDECSCVTSGSNSDCYDYSYISSCHAMITKAPSALRACVVLAAFCTIFACILLTLTTQSLYYPASLATREEIEAAEAAAMADAGIQPTVVAAVTVSPAHQATVTDAYVLNPSDVIIVQPYSNSNATTAHYGAGAGGGGTAGDTKAGAGVGVPIAPSVVNVTAQSSTSTTTNSSGASRYEM